MACLIECIWNDNIPDNIRYSGCVSSSILLIICLALIIYSVKKLNKHIQIEKQVNFKWKINKEIALIGFSLFSNLTMCIYLVYEILFLKIFDQVIRQVIIALSFYIFFYDFADLLEKPESKIKKIKILTITFTLLYIAGICLSLTWDGLSMCNTITDFTACLFDFLFGVTYFVIGTIISGRIHQTIKKFIQKRL